jgi:nucleotide-binding universal stress UspA family protein
MIPTIKKILYATDLSPNSAYVFRYAINSAIKHDANIIILHVFEKISVTTEAQLGVYIEQDLRKKIYDDRRESTIDRIKKRLQIFCEKELEDNAESVNRVESIEMAEGFPAEEILSKADELNCDVIIMGTHGKGIIQHAFLGSTAKRVLRRTRKPVFIIPLPKGELDITFHDDY